MQVSLVEDQGGARLPHLGQRSQGPRFILLSLKLEKCADVAVGHSFYNV